MKKVIIANWGLADQGKSTSIKMVYHNLLDRGFQEQPEYHLGDDSSDIRAVFKKEDVLIGIESQGDPGSRQGESLELFESLECKIIVVASRTKGETIENITRLRDQSGYQVIWGQNGRLDEKSSQETLNQQWAEIVTQYIESIF